jgi:hypothetical protein
MDITEATSSIEFPKARLYIEQIPLFFRKSLKGSVNEVSYETRTPTEFTKADNQTVYVEVDGLEMSDPREWMIEKFPNACSYFRNKKAKLVITYGRMEWMSSKEDSQSLQVSDESDLFLVWRVEDIGFLNGILMNLKNYENMNLKIDLDVADKHFDKESKDRGLNVPVAKMSLTFN